MTGEPRQFQVRNWTQFQHYKNRNPPWIKLHFALLASEDWVALDDASRLLAVVCMLIASRNEGMVPNKPDYVRRVAYLDDLPDFSPLISCGFLEIPQADASTPQADARPEERRGDQRREREEGGAEAPTGGKGFVGSVIRLNISDFERWRRSYSAIPDLVAELTKADAYFVEHPPKGGKWFFPASSWLDREHKAILKRQSEGDEATRREADIYAGLR